MVSVCAHVCVRACVYDKRVQKRTSENVNEVGKQNRRQRDGTIVGRVIILITFIPKLFSQNTEM